MSKISKAISQVGKQAIKTYDSEAVMILAFEQAIQFDNQVFFCLGSKKFYIFNGTATGALANYTELVLEGSDPAIHVAHWVDTNTYEQNDIVGFNGKLYKANSAIVGAGGAANPQADTTNWTLITTGTANEPKLPSWVSTYTYAANDIVERNGLIYVAQTGTNLGKDPAANDVDWFEYRRHFFHNASTLDIARSIAYFQEVPTDGSVVPPREMTQADLDNLESFTYPVWNRNWSTFTWQHG